MVLVHEIGRKEGRKKRYENYMGGNSEFSLSRVEFEMSEASSGGKSP